MSLHLPHIRGEPAHTALWVKSRGISGVERQAGFHRLCSVLSHLAYQFLWLCGPYPCSGLLGRSPRRDPWLGTWDIQVTVIISADEGAEAPPPTFVSKNIPELVFTHAHPGGQWIKTQVCELLLAFQLRHIQQSIVDCMFLLELVHSSSELAWATIIRHCIIKIKNPKIKNPSVDLTYVSH